MVVTPFTMKAFLGVLVFCCVFCFNVEATDSQWSLLRQSEYNMKIEIARTESFNRSYIKYCKTDAVPYNRTFRVLNASLEMVVNLNKQLVIGVQAYKFLSNEYRFFPLTFEFDLCTEYNHDSFSMKQYFDTFSNIQPCFFRKNVHYQIINAVPDYSKFPPHIPYGRYSFHFEMINKVNRNLIALHVVNAEIKEKPKNRTL